MQPTSGGIGLAPIAKDRLSRIPKRKGEGKRVASEEPPPIYRRLHRYITGSNEPMITWSSFESLIGSPFITLRRMIPLPLAPFYHVVAPNPSPRFFTSLKMLSSFLDRFGPFLVLTNPLNEEFRLLSSSHFPHNSRLSFHYFSPSFQPYIIYLSVSTWGWIPLYSSTQIPCIFPNIFNILYFSVHIAICLPISLSG